MPKSIADNELTKLGLFSSHEEMDNGELRFRMLSRDGSSYIRGENREKFVWGNSHSHEILQEVIIVQQGFVVFAELVEDEALFRQLQPGEIFISKHNVPHNHCFGSNTVVHTVKFGGRLETDWIGCPKLDKLTQHLTQQEVMQIVNTHKVY